MSNCSLSPQSVAEIRQEEDAQPKKAAKEPKKAAKEPQLGDNQRFFQPRQSFLILLGGIRCRKNADQNIEKL